MRTRVACETECDQVFLGVLAGLAAELFVMDFQIGHGAARLTSPAVATQHLSPKGLERCRIQAKRRGFGPIEPMMPSRSGLREMPTFALREGI